MTQDKPTNPKDAIASATKLPLHLWPFAATALGCLALLEGALKYGRANWRASGVRASVYKDALDRHMGAWFEGEDTDPCSGLPHLAHALACLAILVDAQANGALTDDRQYHAPTTNPRAWTECITLHVSRLLALHKDRPEPKHYDRRDSPEPDLPGPALILRPDWFRSGYEP